MYPKVTFTFEPKELATPNAHGLVTCSTKVNGENMQFHFTYNKSEDLDNVANKAVNEYLKRMRRIYG